MEDELDDPALAIILPIGVQSPAPEPLACPCCGRLLLIERVIVRAFHDDDAA